MDIITETIRTRVFKGLQVQDDLWVRVPEEKGNTFVRARTDFVRVNDTTMVIHVEHEDQLRSFMLTLNEMED